MGSCDTINDLCYTLYVLDKTENLNLNLNFFKMITGRKKAKKLA